MTEKENPMEFISALATYQEEFDQAEVFDNWYPPDNNYTVSITGIKKGVTEKDGEPFVWWKIMAVAHADDPEVNNRDFQMAFFSRRTFGMMKGFVHQITQNTEKRSIAEYDRDLEKSVGTICEVRVHREKSTKTGKMFTAVDLVKVLNKPGDEKSAEATA